MGGSSGSAPAAEEWGLPAGGQRQQGGKEANRAGSDEPSIPSDERVIAFEMHLGALYINPAATNVVWQWDQQRIAQLIQACIRLS